MLSEFAAGQHDPAPIHPGILAAVTALGEIMAALVLAVSQSAGLADPFLATTGVESPPVPPLPPSFLRYDPAAPRLDRPFVLPLAVAASPLGRLRDALDLIACATRWT